MSSLLSPSKFQGLPWESWTNALGRTSPIADKPPELISTEKNKGCVLKLPKEAEKPPESTPVGTNKGYVMKLPKEDMKTYGLCPERDPFTVIMCDSCNLLVKPQALLSHYETRHSNRPSENPPAQPPTDVVATEKVKIKTKVKSSSKKTMNKDSKGREGVVNPPPSLPVSLTLETPIAEAGSSKGESLQPIVALTPLSGAPIAAAPAVTTVAPVVAKAPRRPPRKHAPIKEREYDPDKHCGVVTAETMKPCTWSLTCKSHPMSLRRAVTGRSKPFDQLLADHRQAKEALIQAKKKNLEQQNASVTLTPPAAQPSALPVLEPKPTKIEKISIVEPVTTTVVQRLPEMTFDMTSSNPTYLSAIPSSLVLSSHARILHQQPTAPVTAPPTSAAQTDTITYTHNHPRALGVTSMFSTHKIGGLVYSNRRMQIARQGLESCLQRAGNGIYMSAHRGDLYSQSSSLSNMLNHVSSRAALQKKRTKADKPNRPNKKVCLTKESTLNNLQINNLKSVLSRQYPNTQNRLIAPTEPTFHLPNILGNVLKRSTDVSTSKIQNKKIKKKTPPVVSTVLSNHSKNGLQPTVTKTSAPYVRAVVNGKHESEPKPLGLGETPKLNNANKIFSETDVRKMGVRFEIFE
ncbi:ataxin-7-like protein 1 [Macrosteles quadrilineatus]|uniref:ataxin-7-like protein 1 n=1 Tax=Macrosteles quadrilineatus TaxID=74068 RepID=UPI0023E1B9E2|nr:ataxin-7-like protein 1 [Macrosteles quadrilineatus]